MAIFSSKQTCGNSECQREIPGNASFCPFCGRPAKGGRQKCGNCGAEMGSADRFCRNCGSDMTAVEHPSMVGNTWARRSNDFAARIDVDDVRGFFRRMVTVEPGTNAILIQAGRSLGVMPPGQYTLDTLMALLGLSGVAPVTAILMDVGDSNIKFTLEDIYTSDPLRIVIDCQIVLQLDNALLFLTNLMRSQRAYTLDQLRDYLVPEVDNAVRDYVRTRKVEDLNVNTQTIRDIELDIEAHLNRTLSQVGLRLVQVRTLNYRCVKWDALREKKEEYWLELSRREAELAGRKTLFDVLTREQVQTLAEETLKVQVYEQRAVVYERMRRAVLSDKMADVRTEEELEKFLLEVDRDHLLRANEMEEFKRDFAERKQDHDGARANLLAKLSLERDYELKGITLRLRHDLDSNQLQAELDLERQKVEGKLANETRQVELQMTITKQQAEFRRSQEQLDDVARRERELAAFQAGLQRQLATAQTQADIMRINLEVEKAQYEMDLLMIERIKTIQRHNLEETNRIELARKAEELRIEMLRQDAEMERQLRLQQQQLDYELERLRTLGTLSTEALISTAGPEQARLLAELKTTEALRGMTEEQILARAAEKSPEVAAAFAEKFRQNPELQKQMQALYDRLLSEQKEATNGRDALQRETLTHVHAMFDKALDSQRDIATSYARGSGSQSPVVVVAGGGAGGAQVVPLASGQQSAGQVTMKCPKCSRIWDPGTRFCPTCGVELV